MLRFVGDVIQLGLFGSAASQTPADRRPCQVSAARVCITVVEALSGRSTLHERRSEGWITSGAKGSSCVCPLFKLIAGKRPVGFRCPETASRQCVLTTRICRSTAAVFAVPSWVTTVIRSHACLVEKNRANLVSTDIHVSNVSVVDDEANGLVNAGAHTERIDRHASDPGVERLVTSLRLL
ncbi:hypothetical protein BCh11DRAFT_07537 [Burkholderia sp. Ch1-1]|nr:hypothetical protein BCh11DRAFT_07537 [Burkholderia sp. Ch1-1]